MLYFELAVLYDGKGVKVEKPDYLLVKCLYGVDRTNGYKFFLSLYIHPFTMYFCSSIRDGAYFSNTYSYALSHDLLWPVDRYYTLTNKYGQRESLHVFE